jgi:hypothetical protein
MRSLFGNLVILCVIIAGGLYSWNHLHREASPSAVPKQALDPIAQPRYDEARQAQEAVKFAGPLAAYMEKAENDAESKLGIETLQPASQTPNPAEHVGGSVVGSSRPILQTTFRVRAAVQVPFEVPAHAATPHLIGAYQSFLKQPAAESREEDGNIEFLVLNEEQYSAFLDKRTGEAVFAADDADQQSVNTSLPPTLNQPQKYHLIFRNNSKRPQKKFVQADFRMEF